MNVKEFLDLPEDQRQFLINTYNKQKRIRETRANIAAEQEKLKTRELNNQLECEHPFATKTYKAYEDDYGSYTGSGEYRYKCDDCGNYWTKPKGVW